MIKFTRSELNEGINFLKLLKVIFDTDVLVSLEEGEIAWDINEGTLAIGMEHGVSLQVGQEMYIRAKNESGVTIYNGEAVFIDGASGNRPTISKANASEDISRRTIAIATEDIAINNNGFCTTIGIVRNVDTSAFSEGDPLYLSALVAGELTNIKPSEPNYAVNIGYVVRPHATEGQVFVSIDHESKITDLSDTQLISLLSGDQLYYDAVSSTWKNIESGFNAVSRWNDISLSADALRLGASSPDVVSVPGTSLTVRAFDGLGTLEELDGVFEIAHTTKLDTLLRPHIHWLPTTADAGAVKWNLEYSISNIGEAITTSTTISVVDATNETAWEHQVIEFPTIDITGYSINAQIKFRLFRDPTDVNDTYEADAGLLSFGIHYETDGDGSRTVFEK